MRAYERTRQALLALRRGEIEAAGKFLEAACAEVSLLESRFCEAKYKTHDWGKEELDSVLGGIVKVCKRCGCSRWRPENVELKVVENEKD